MSELSNRRGIPPGLGLDGSVQQQRVCMAMRVLRGNVGRSREARGGTLDKSFIHCPRYCLARARRWAGSHVQKSAGSPSPRPALRLMASWQGNLHALDTRSASGTGLLSSWSCLVLLCLWRALLLSSVPWGRAKARRPACSVAGHGGLLGQTRDKEAPSVLARAPAASPGQAPLGRPEPCDWAPRLCHGMQLIALCRLHVTDTTTTDPFLQPLAPCRGLCVRMCVCVCLPYTRCDSRRLLMAWPSACTAYDHRPSPEAAC